MPPRWAEGHLGCGVDAKLCGREALCLAVAPAPAPDHHDYGRTQPARPLHRSPVPRPVTCPLPPPLFQAQIHYTWGPKLQWASNGTLLWAFEKRLWREQRFVDEVSCR